MQMEISSSEGVQQGVGALSFVHFCYAIFEGEQARRGDWWLGSEQRVPVFLKRLGLWLMCLPAFRLCFTRCNLVLLEWAICQEETARSRLSWTLRLSLVSGGCVAMSRRCFQE